MNYYQINGVWGGGAREFQPGFADWISLVDAAITADPASQRIAQVTVNFSATCKHQRIVTLLVPPDQARGQV